MERNAALCVWLEFPGNGAAGLATRGTITAILFDAEGEDREVEPIEDFASVPDQQIYWVIATGEAAYRVPGMPERWRKARAFDRLTVGDHTFSFAVPAAPNGAGLSEDTVTFVVGRNWLATLSDKPLALTEDYLKDDTGQTLKGSLTAQALCVSLLLAHFDQFHAQLSDIGDRIDAIDDQVLRSRQRHDPLVTLAVLRRQTARIRSIVALHRPVIAALDRPDFGPTASSEDSQHLGHLAEVYQRLVDTVDRTREAVLSSYDLYATRVAQKTNVLLERLTVITIGVGLIGAVAGVFGMNFALGLFEQGERPFWLVVAAMATVAAVTLAIAIRRMRQP